jgi:predicted nucleotidyltransferase
VDVSHPIHVVVPTLDGDVLEVMAKTTRPLTGLEIAGLAGRGSPSGIRLALARLTEQGILHAEQRAQAVFYTANRAHLAWPAVESMVTLGSVLFNRVRDELQEWSAKPLHASIFGSMARGDGDHKSDIDILLIRPDETDEEQPNWAGQVDRLRAQVRSWTGSNCQVFQIDLSRFRKYHQINDPLVQEWIRDGIRLFGAPLSEML